MIAPGNRQRVDAKRRDFPDGIDDAFVGQVPGIGVYRAVTHHAASLGASEHAASS
jgi:hypothetical protein